MQPHSPTVQARRRTSKHRRLRRLHQPSQRSNNLHPPILPSHHHTNTKHRQPFNRSQHQFQASKHRSPRTQLPTKHHQGRQDNLLTRLQHRTFTKQRKTIHHRQLNQRKLRTRRLYQQPTHNIITLQHPRHQNRPNLCKDKDHARPPTNQTNHTQRPTTPTSQAQPSPQRSTKGPRHATRVALPTLSNVPRGLRTLLACSTSSPLVFDDKLFLFLFTKFVLICDVFHHTPVTQVICIVLFSLCFCCGSDNVCFLLLVFTTADSC